MTPYCFNIWVIIDSGNGLLPDGTKPLSEPMLISQKWGSVVLTPEHFHTTAQAAILYNELENCTLKISATYIWGQCVNNFCHKGPVT